jgi:hypothetical protein
LNETTPLLIVINPSNIKIRFNTVFKLGVLAGLTPPIELNYSNN